jgi:hypothetical protein
MLLAQWKYGAGTMHNFDDTKASKSPKQIDMLQNMAGGRTPHFKLTKARYFTDGVDTMKKYG